MSKAIYTQIRIPEAIATKIEEEAIKNYRTITQQVLYWVELGKKYEELQKNESFIKYIKNS